MILSLVNIVKKFLIKKKKSIFKLLIPLMPILNAQNWNPKEKKLTLRNLMIIL